MHVVKRLLSTFVDHPTVVTTLLVGIVAVQFTVSALWLHDLDFSLFFSQLSANEQRSVLSQLALGLAGVAAMVGGFAGVVVVFGLSSEDARFREVRMKAATSLRRNWTSVVTTPLVAAFGALLAAAAAGAEAFGVCLWTIELCLLLAAHGAVRLVVILRELVKVVHRADEGATRHEQFVDEDEFFED
jgi:hypothetical protein